MITKLLFFFFFLTNKNSYQQRYRTDNDFRPDSCWIRAGVCRHEIRNSPLVANVKIRASRSLPQDPILRSLRATGHGKPITNAHCSFIKPLVTDLENITGQSTIKHSNTDTHKHTLNAENAQWTTNAGRTTLWVPQHGLPATLKKHRRIGRGGDECYKDRVCSAATSAVLSIINSMFTFAKVRKRIVIIISVLGTYVTTLVTGTPSWGRDNVDRLPFPGRM